ncbi:MAG: fructose-1,6-bisphosphatase [Clostridia bacterium]
MKNFKKLQLLSEIYPTIEKAATEIINFQSVINLPKGTEHFITDIHGEYDSFSHVLKNGSGSVARKIEEVFGHTLALKDKQALATLIYYPAEKIDIIKTTESDMDAWYKITLYRLIEICKRVTSKYTRSKVRKALPKDFAYIIEELITEKYEVLDKEAYYEEIVTTVIRIGQAKSFIIALSELIQQLVIDHLHILGDIYDRGPGAARIMDELLTYHSLDIQWGNHDVIWMGAASGQTSCISNVVRICAKYGNLDTLEVGYGINLLPLATFAIETYENDNCSRFSTKAKSESTKAEVELNQKIHKAISVIQFKLEGQLIKSHPEFEMDDRNFLHLIDYDNNTVKIGDQTYNLLDINLPTVDKNDPYKLSDEEYNIVKRLKSAFVHSEKLHQHMLILLNKGGLYKVHNGNLLFHGCVPMTENGEFEKVKLFSKEYQGKDFYDVLDGYARKAFFAVDLNERENGKDILWWIWCNKHSPLYGKDKMTSFERYFIEDKSTHKEIKNPYYSMLENDKIVSAILNEFGLNEDTSHIVNGHVPVLQTKGESPVKCGGKVLVIDGGFAKAYQKVTGIAGYTLIFNSYGLILVAHEPFTSTEDAINNERDIVSQTVMIKKMPSRLSVGDTDNGAMLKERIEDLEELLKAYRDGTIVPKSFH